MRTKILLTILVVSFFAACEKDKYQTRPQLEFKKVNRTVVNQNEVLTFTIQVTDAEGDVQDSIWIEKVTRNCAASNVKSGVRMPEFTPIKDLNAEIEVSYFHGIDPQNRYPPIASPQCRKNDTSYYRFWVKDKAKNVSDTAVSEQVVIIY